MRCAGGEERVHGGNKVEQTIQLGAVANNWLSPAQFCINHPAGLHIAQVPHAAGSDHQQHGHVPHTAGKVNEKGVLLFDFFQQLRDGLKLCFFVHTVRHLDHHQPFCRDVHLGQKAIPEVFQRGAGAAVRHLFRFFAHPLAAQCQNAVRGLPFLYQISHRALVGLGLGLGPDLRVLVENAHI